MISNGHSNDRNLKVRVRCAHLRFWARVKAINMSSELSLHCESHR